MARVMTVVVAAQGTSSILTIIFQCIPVNAAWDSTVTSKKCIDINAFYLANAVANIATDLITYTLPMQLVSRIHLPRKQKVALGVMLCLGLLYVSPSFLLSLSLSFLYTCSSIHSPSLYMFDRIVVPRLLTLAFVSIAAHVSLPSFA
jgi:hypothetical protein